MVIGGYYACHIIYIVLVIGGYYAFHVYCMGFSSPPSLPPCPCPSVSSSRLTAGPHEPSIAGCATDASPDVITTAHG
ncbi:unnamed protein product, partial [Closterium sp. NIES-65]